MLLMNQTPDNPDSSYPPNSYLSSEYLEWFSPEELKFRWTEALGLETSKWRRSTELYTALMLASFMDAEGSCFPALESLAQPMKKSQDTVRRSLKILEEEGWLVVIPRPNRSNIYQAILPHYGLIKLIEKRKQKRQVFSFYDLKSSMEGVLGLTLSAYGFNWLDTEFFPDWARLEGRIIQLINQMGGPSANLAPLVRWMTEGAYSGVETPVAFLLKRAGDFSKAYNHLRRKPKER